MASVVIAFLFGLVWGSFLNVVALRYNTGETLGGRSYCFSCSKVLSWHELIPVVSFLALRGRCSKCHAKISLQYPVVELSAGFLFALLVSSFMNGLMSGLELVLMLLLFSIAIVIVVYDLKHTIIPEGPVYSFMILSLIAAFVGIDAFSVEKLAAILSSGPAVALPLFLLWLFSHGTWIGFGDVKIALGMGWLLGAVYGFSALIVSFWIGALYGLSLMGFQRLPRIISFLTCKCLTCKWSESHEKASFRISERPCPAAPGGLGSAAGKEIGAGQSGPYFLTMKSEIPFGPFLIAGTMLVYFIPVDVLGVSRLFGLY